MERSPQTDHKQCVISMEQEQEHKKSAEVRINPGYDDQSYPSWQATGFGFTSSPKDIFGSEVGVSWEEVKYLLES